MEPKERWTEQSVSNELIEAFRRLPSLPVFTAGRRIQATTADRLNLISALNWAPLLDQDSEARKFLWAWARCRATQDSFGALCRAMGWPRATAEDGRRRAARAIAVALSSDHTHDGSMPPSARERQPWHSTEN